MGLVAIQISVQLESRTCGTCGIPFAAPDYFWSQRKRDGEGYYCPNGHSWIFTETEAARLKKEVDQLRNDLEWQKGRVAVKERELIAQKGLTTKAKKALARVDNGVCPKCNRHFVNVERHMKTKHCE